MVGFITSRAGHIEELNVYVYEITGEAITNREIHRNLENSLKEELQEALFRYENDHFITFLPVAESVNQYYREYRKIRYTKPFSDLQLISFYISTIIKRVYSQRFKRFLKTNGFVIEKKRLGPFMILKLFEFNPVIFKNGKFLIHFYPVSKIISSKKVMISDLSKIYNELPQVKKDLAIHLIALNEKGRCTIDLNENEWKIKAQKFLEKHNDCIASFDYFFLSKYSTEIFSQIQKETKRLHLESIETLKDIAKQLDLIGCRLNPKPFFKIDMKNISSQKNLLVGKNTLVNKQSAAYYHGIYLPVKQKTILPVYIGHSEENKRFYDLLKTFNQEGSCNLIKSVIVPKLDPENFPFENIGSCKENLGKDFIVALFTKSLLPPDIVVQLKNMKISFQIFEGQFGNDDYKLSNYVVKCLQKLGGILNVIADTKENEDSWFCGIDLGHQHNKQKSNSFSKLGVCFYNNKGILEFKGSLKTELNEEINSIALSILFGKFKNKINKKIRKLIVHRDGKLFKKDMDTIIDKALLVLDVEEIDILEIIKSGYPVISTVSEKNQFLIPDSGSYWILEEENYALLVTNTQAKEKDCMVNPIIIKKVFGDTLFQTLVEQVYWFTKVYSNNLYNSTRLPATIERANSIVRTGEAQHYSSYLG